MNWLNLFVSIVAGVIGGAGAGILVIRVERRLQRRGPVRFQIWAFLMYPTNLDTYAGQMHTTIEEAQLMKCDVSFRVRNEKEVDVELRDLRLEITQMGHLLHHEPMMTLSSGTEHTGPRSTPMRLVVVSAEQSLDLELHAYLPAGSNTPLLFADQVDLVADYGRAKQLRAALTFDVGAVLGDY